MIDQILKFLCILSFVTFLFKRLPLLINKKMLYLLLGCVILYILYSVYIKWKKEKGIEISFEEKIKERSDSFEERLDSFEERLKERLDSFEERLDSFEEKLKERLDSFEEKIKERFDSFEEKIISILQENRPKGKKKE
jgi:DNA anti-recombination protein RmuC